jgi:hypothetical protein
MVTLPSGETPPLTQVDGGVFFGEDAGSGEG